LPSVLGKPAEGIEGSWQVVSEQHDGEQPDPDQPPVVMKIAGTTLTATYGARLVGQGTAKWDAGKTPHTIDLTVTSLIGTTSGRTTDSYGIYEVNGNTLRIYHAPKPELRPTAFPTGRDWKGTLISCKRV
jgi:uncharacterized protein (TIGR03067 family)